MRWEDTLDLERSSTDINTNTRVSDALVIALSLAVLFGCLAFIIWAVVH